MADHRTAVSRTNDPSSFAYPTARERWPRIFNQIVEDISNASKSLTNDQDREIGEELKAKITSLKDGMLNNATLSLLSEDGDPDIPDYNAELTAQGDPTWLNGPWLFIECYQYRVVYQIFRESGSLFWQEYDMFASSKRNGLIGSKKGTLELIRRFHALRSSLDEKAIDEDTPKLLFEEMVQISLWGNATDLSLLGSVSVSQLDSLQGKKARDAAKANVLADDTAAAFALLSSLRQGGKVGEIHYVLDNAGFELLTDLVLAWFLLASGYCNKMILHGKRMPWFVSDVNEHDLKDLLAALSDPNFWPDLSDEEKADLNEAAGQWRVAFDDGKMEYRAHPFWTTGHSFGRMHIVAPKLYDQYVPLISLTITRPLNFSPSNPPFPHHH